MDTQYSSCIYRSKDPVKNFKIKVSLHKAAGRLYLNDREQARANEKSKKEQEREEKEEENKEDKTDHLAPLLPEKEDVTINWQVKMFSRREFIKYSDPAFVPKNNLEEHYNKECLKLRERDYFPGRIFTFIDSDPYEFYDEIDGEVHSAQRDIIPTYLENVKGASLRNRRPLIGKAKSDEESIPHNNIVSYDSSKEDAKRRDTKLRPFHTMYIMADLSNLDNKLYEAVPEGKSKREKSKINKEKVARDKERARFERVLCCIRIDSNGCIIMKPKFNLTGVPYLVQTGGFARETYQYSLEHVSGTITADNLLKEHRLHKELYMRHSEYLKNLVGKEFKMPNIGVLKVHVFGEIVSAKNFDYDDLHVYYQLELPKNWHVDRTSPISGFTQTSRIRTNNFNDDEIAYFAHPFEFDLYYKNDEINSNNKDELPKMPKILFEVASYDSWNRYRTEGYTWTQIPVKPGTCEEEKVCWRPRGDSIIYELRRFFIGGSPELEDISYACIPADYDGKVLSRYGFRTTTTGTLSIKMNVAFQSQLFLGKKKTKEQSNLLDKIGNYSSMNDLIKALEELNMARLRMIEARENAKKLLGD